jgi:hypothetical protein
VQGSNAAGIDVVIDRHKYVSWAQSDADVNNMPQLTAEKFFKGKGYQLAKEVFEDIASVMTSGNYGGTNVYNTTISGFNADSVIDISTKADEAGFPDFERSLILSPSLHSKIRKDLKAADGFGSDVVMRQGLVPSLDTFDNVYKTSMLPENDEDLIGVAVHPDAVAVAIRYLAPQEGHGYNAAEPLVDDETKITLGYRQYYDEAKGTLINILECNYGFKVANTNGLIRIREV